MELDKLLDYVEEQQNKTFTGIPLGFNRYSSILPSISKGSSYVILAGAGVGKTAFTIDKFLMTPVRFAYNNPNLINLHIDYFDLEETPQRHDLRILSNLAYRELNKEFSINDFNNTKGNKLLLNKTSELKPLQSIVDYYNKVVSTYYVKSPSLIKKKILESIANLKKQGVNIKDENFYYIVIIDNLKFVRRDSGHNSDKQAIDDLCLNILQELRQEYNIIPVVLQHEAEDNDDYVINIKGDIIDNKLKPSLKKLGVSKYTADPATHVLGLMNCAKFGIDTYPKNGGYNIKLLQDNIRILIPLKMRDGGEGQEMALHFKGNVSAVEELPHISEFIKDNSLYNKYITITPAQQNNAGTIKPTFKITI